MGKRQKSETETTPENSTQSAVMELPKPPTEEEIQAQIKEAEKRAKQEAKKEVDARNKRWTEKSHGTRIEIELEARYIKGDKSVDEYMKQTALTNPHAQIIYVPPATDGKAEKIVYKRTANKLPPETKAIKPHPHGIELGNLIKILHSSKSRNISSCLRTEFSRVGPKVANDICKQTGIDPHAAPHRIVREDAEKLYKAINNTKISAPPTDCISPIGEEQIIASLKANVKADFYAAVTRRPTVYRGNPFQIEVGLAYGIPDWPQDESIKVMRYANRVPLLYQPGACAITKATIANYWRRYGLEQSKGAIPVGPMFLLVHIASVWVPFTSEAKEAIAHYPEIMREIELGLQEVGRRLYTHLNKRRAAEYELKRRSIFELYIEELSTSLNKITKESREKIRSNLIATAKKATKAGEI